MEILKNRATNHWLPHSTRITFGKLTQQAMFVTLLLSLENVNMHKGIERV